MGQLQREYFERLGRGLKSPIKPGCDGKAAYDNAGIAHQVLAAQQKRGQFGRSGAGEIEVYRCFHCRSWHIGLGAERSNSAIRRRQRFTPAKQEA